MAKKRPHILSIAGFDPSSGAGFTTDLKTFERLKCYGFAVQTANTIQTDTTFEDCFWIDKEVILHQLETILQGFKISVVKIGIIQDWALLLECIQRIKEYSKNSKIILDPVLKSSTNFQFQQSNEKLFDEVLEHVYLVTPNYDEIQQLYSGKSTEKTIEYVAKKTNLYLKGGHRADKIGQDELFTTEGKRFVINPKNKKCTEKHGSGCVLSSAIASYIALGFPLLKSCFRAKKYVEDFLSSNNSLLGYHK